MKAPALLVDVIVIEVGVIGYQFIIGLPAELFGQNSHQRALAHADIAGDADVLAAGWACLLHGRYSFAAWLRRAEKEANQCSPDYNAFMKIQAASAIFWITIDGRRFF